MHRADIFAAINEERDRQDKFHPSFDDMSNGVKLAVLVEEVGEVSAEVQMGNRLQMRDELIQVAAVAIRWLEGMG